LSDHTSNHRRVSKVQRHIVAIVLIGLLGACSVSDLVGTGSLPSNLSDPASMNTRSGALAAYVNTLAQFRVAFGGNVSNTESVTSFVQSTGLLSDELLSATNLNRSQAAFSGLDVRVLPEGAGSASGAGEGQYASTYAALQKVRGQAREAVGLLGNYAPTTSPALRGHLYAVQGYSEVMLAELFCSGIPLSTLDYDGDYTLKPGSSTANVLTNAIALFDTALTLSSDSARILNLARLGKARSLLGLGRFAEAAQAVADVPDGYRYEVSYSAATQPKATNFAEMLPGQVWSYTTADLEGVNGLGFRSTNDPRTASTFIGQNTDGVTVFHPDMYAIDGSSPIVLADWTEARLIEAEAALQAGDGTTWLAKLNQLRESAITPALPDTTDPVDRDARIDLTFRERAFWLFLTGHRQGDLRRLIRQYGRNSVQVYPSGVYQGGATYGNDVTAPIPAAERLSNTLFTGCIGRGA
jgi:hypothetical protein